MKPRKWTDEQFIIAVKESLSYAEVIKKLGLVCAGSNYDTVKRKIKELNLDTSHMTGMGWNTGVRYRPVIQARPLDEILVKDSPYININHLRERLFKESVKEQRCECCGLTEWLNKPIRFEIHHINGDNKDHRLENIQILCPNCHSLTDNYRGKNKVLSTHLETNDVNAG